MNGTSVENCFRSKWRNKIRRDPKVVCELLLVLYEISMYMNQEGGAFIRPRFVAQNTGFDSSELQEILDELVGTGYIRITKGHHKANDPTILHIQALIPEGHKVNNDKANAPSIQPAEHSRVGITAD